MSGDSDGVSFKGLAKDLAKRGYGLGFKGFKGLVLFSGVYRDA